MGELITVDNTITEPPIPMVRVLADVQLPDGSVMTTEVLIPAIVAHKLGFPVIEDSGRNGGE